LAPALLAETRPAELDVVEAELAKTEHAIDRYLAAFERGTIDDHVVAERLRELRDKSKQLPNHRDDRTAAVLLHHDQPCSAISVSQNVGAPRSGLESFDGDPRGGSPLGPAGLLG
jgi:hypothetical protein